jgi:hypothetical protein
MEVENIIFSEEIYLSLWIYVWPLLLWFVSVFLIAYLKKKAKNLATKEDYELLLVHIKRTTEETEGIKVELAKTNWLHQQNWSLKKEYYSGFLEALYSLQLSLSCRLDYYIEPGSVFRDNEISENECFKKQSRIGSDQLKKIQLLRGPAAIVISKRAIEALDDVYAVDWQASNFSVFNKEYLDELNASVESAYQVILEESRLELLQ